MHLEESLQLKCAARLDPVAAEVLQSLVSLATCVACIASTDVLQKLLAIVHGRVRAVQATESMMNQAAARCASNREHDEPSLLLLSTGKRSCAAKASQSHGPTRCRSLATLLLSSERDPKHCFYSTGGQALQTSQSMIQRAGGQASSPSRPIAQRASQQHSESDVWLKVSTCAHA
eukprot:scaffold182068_cov18-Tisochrysis_lutea.AAC.3